MKKINLGTSDLQVTPICLGTMTFGEQVAEKEAHAILDRSLGLGVNFLDTAEMYSVPAKAETFGSTERILGNWFASTPGARQKVLLATKVAGPSRGMPWVREGAGMTAQDILNSCNASLKRLQTDVIDLYQIHWPERHVPAFGMMYFDPTKAAIETAIHEQLEAMAQLVKAGKVRYIGLSNETPYGTHEFVRLAEQHGLPRVMTVQNPYCLVNRTFDNAMDETCHRLGVSLLAYSPLAFSFLTGKHLNGIQPTSRLGLFPQFTRYASENCLKATQMYQELAQNNGLTLTQMALAFVNHQSFVTATIIGATTVEQLKENIAAFDVKLTPEIISGINKIQAVYPDPAP
jgi:aryl-alcohol dehydrogenase-like predicted oxidoreductase